MFNKLTVMIYDFCTSMIERNQQDLKQEGQELKNERRFTNHITWYKRLPACYASIYGYVCGIISSEMSGKQEHTVVAVNDNFCSENNFCFHCYAVL